MLLGLGHDYSDEHHHSSHRTSLPCGMQAVWMAGGVGSVGGAAGPGGRAVDFEACLGPGCQSPGSDPEQLNFKFQFCVQTIVRKRKFLQSSRIASYTKDPPPNQI